MDDVIALNASDDFQQWHEDDENPPADNAEWIPSFPAFDLDPDFPGILFSLGA